MGFKDDPNGIGRKPYSGTGRIELTRMVPEPFHLFLDIYCLPEVVVAVRHVDRRPSNPAFLQGLAQGGVVILGSYAIVQSLPFWVIIRDTISRWVHAREVVVAGCCGE